MSFLVASMPIPGRGVLSTVGRRKYPELRLLHSAGLQTALDLSKIEDFAQAHISCVHEDDQLTGTGDNSDSIGDVGFIFF